MGLGSLEERAGDGKTNSRLRRAGILVRSKLPEIEGLLKKGRGVCYIWGVIFRREISYGMFLKSYERVTGRKPISWGDPIDGNRDLSMYKGRSDIPESVISAVLAHIAYKEGLSSFLIGEYPKAIEKY